MFFAVKLYDTEAALAMLPPLVGPDTVVIPFQNGVDSVAMLTRTVGAPHTAGGTCYVSAVVAEPGVVRHTAMDHLVFGELDGRRSARLEWLLDACGPAGFRATLSPDITVDIWTKFVRLSVFSGITAVARSPLGASAATRSCSRCSKTRCAKRRQSPGRKASPCRPPTPTTPRRAYTALPPETKSSMLEDLERGRRLELPWLSGAVVRIGDEVGVPTPTHRFINAVLGPHVNGRYGSLGCSRAIART